MQIAAGVQRHGGHVGRELQGRVGGEHVLLHMPGIEPMPLAERQTGLDQRRVVFEARQLLLCGYQAAAQMTFA